jgi:hypothetical protein
MTGLVVLKHCIVEYTDWGVITHFPQSITGAQAHGVPHYDDKHYWVASHRAGCGDNLLRYAQEHDAAHSLVSEWLTDSASDVLWNLAHKTEPNPYGAICEEALAQMLQRWCRCNEEPIISGVDWHGLRAYALGRLG